MKTTAEALEDVRIAGGKLGDELFNPIRPYIEKIVNMLTKLIRRIQK